ncbi:MAG: thiolase family protein [Planctomycetota bacterium]|nr:acetyl-CoA acetyltransferase [Candidatus Woesearchaeota archaeon]MDP6386487.1 thiolase family protein [Planctomycetota bacterium]
MPLAQAHIPYGAYWSSPFCRWQGSFAREHSIELAGRVGAKFLTDRGYASELFDGVALGTTVYQRQNFYGAPWAAGLMGLETLTGPTYSQACATSARMLVGSALEVEAGQRRSILNLACDRVSNGPHVYFPDPDGPGGTGTSEDPVMGNFNKDPWAGGAMIGTAEAVAAESGIGREEQEEVALLRYQQYAESLADDRAFQRRYMVDVERKRGRKTIGLVEGDEGVHPMTAEGLTGLRPMLPDGTITFGTQTHPADGNAGMVVCDAERAKELSTNPSVSIRILGYGEARVEKGLMPKATVPAAHAALAHAGVAASDCDAVKTHNPFAVADLWFCREMGFAPENVNRFGSPLIWGHPQGPMGLRVVAELIEELVERGGGLGLFSGCAGGDSAMALCLRVDC